MSVTRDASSTKHNFAFRGAHGSIKDADKQMNSSHVMLKEV